MAIRVDKNKEGQKTYTVYCGGTDNRGQRVQLRRRGLKTEREAKAVEFELRRQIVNKKDEAPCYKWEEWFAICIERMKVELKPSTIIEYNGKNTHWIEPFFKGKLLSEVTPQDVHEVVFNPEFDVMWYTRRGTLRRMNRIFQLAMDEGLISSNPTLRVRVKVPESRKAVLNRNEIDKLLLQAKKVEHRFYEVWVLAVMTWMRSGELYALKWDDICFEQRVIWVQRSWTSKNGFGTTKSARYRVVPVSDELDLFLEELKLQSDSREGFVLPRMNEWARGSGASSAPDTRRKGGSQR